MGVVSVASRLGGIMAPFILLMVSYSQSQLSTFEVEPL